MKDRKNKDVYGKMRPCINYYFPGIKPLPSYTCKGCINRKPIVDTDEFVLSDDTVNCYNFDYIEGTGIKPRSQL